MKRIFFMTLFVALTTITYGQTDDKGYEEGKWVLKGVTGLNLSQTAMSNWSAGGENSVAGNAYLNGALTHKTGDWLWVTNLALDYGLSKTKSQGMRKSTDNITLSTQLGYSTNNVWYYTLMGDLNTQFAKGYNYPDKTHYISNFFAPAYSNISVGMEYRPKSNYSVYLSPASTKMTFVEDDYLSELGAFGVDPGDRFRMEWGAYLKARAELTVMENVNLITTADFFTHDGRRGTVYFRKAYLRLCLSGRRYLLRLAVPQYRQTSSGIYRCLCGHGDPVSGGTLSVESAPSENLVLTVAVFEKRR